MPRRSQQQNRAMLRYRARGAMRTPANRRRAYQKPDPLGDFSKVKKNDISSTFPNFLKNAPFKPRKSVKMVYKDVVGQSAGALGTYGAIKEYRLNSLYDPDKTGVGHQPYGFDQMSSLYNAYKVSGVLVDLKVHATTSNVSFGVMITNPTGTTQSIAGLTSAQVGEKAMARSFFVPDTGTQTKRIKFFLPLNEIFNLTKEQYRVDVDQSSALTSGNPASEVELQFAVADISGGSTANAITEITLTYYSTFYDRIVQPQS